MHTIELQDETGKLIAVVACTTGAFIPRKGETLIFAKKSYEVIEVNYLCKKYSDDETTSDWYHVKRLLLVARRIKED